MTRQPLRFLVTVDREWRVTFCCPALELAGPSRQMRRLPDADGGIFPLAPEAELPGPGAEIPACCRRYCGTTDPAVLTEGRQQIIDRNPDPVAGTSPFGGYLFHTLIGTDAWEWVRKTADGQDARCVELALSWRDDDANLNRLNWELMHDGDSFLAAGLPGVTVAITRLVAGTIGARWKPRQCEEFPPRILFVVGTTLNDPGIRPAAEFLGLLRELRESGRRIRARVLEKTRMEELERVIRVFRPDVVHFICHGDWELVGDRGRGYLELTPDEPNGDRRKYADQLYAAMTVDGRPAPLVVLSACRTGSAEAPPPAVLEGAHDLAPLATELVRLGVPLVLGMAGRVSDTACRLFTRQFGDALVRGESLVAATAEARRATVAQGRSADESVDWAFPALFAAEEADPGFAPVPAGAAAAPTPEENWIQDYALGRAPVFCSRNEFFDAYYGFFSPAPQPQRVLAIVADGQPGVGRTRLLFELATQMLRDGHIPIMLVSDEPDFKAPQSLREFAEKLWPAISQARRVLQLGSAPESQLALLPGVRSALRPGQTSLRRDIEAELGAEGELTPVALRMALQADLHRLVKDARKRHESFRRAEGRAVVLLDQVEQYGGLMSDVIFRMLDPSGFGTSEEPIPAVLALATGQPANTVVKDALERAASRSWLLQKQLKPFDFKTEEDLLAYSWILLNPPPNFCLDRHVLNHQASREVAQMAHGFLWKTFGGLPGKFANSAEFEGFTKGIGMDAFVLPLASDEEDLQALDPFRLELDRQP